MLNGLAEAVIVCAPDGVTELVNTAAVRLLPEVVVGKPLAGCPVAPLTRALGACAGAFDGEHQGRRLRGLRRRMADGRCVWYVRDLTTDARRTEALLAERARGAFLAEAGNRLSLPLDREQTVQAVVGLPVPFLADCAALVLPPVNGECRWTRCGRGEPGPVCGGVAVQRLAAVPGLVESFAADPADAGPWRTAGPADLAWLLPETFGPVGDVLVAPAPGPGGPAGALVAVRGAARRAFDQRDIALVEQFAARAGGALTTAALYGEQLRMVQILQASLLPPSLPEIAGVRLAAGYRPAGETPRIGGDFYDAFGTADGGTFALGDVCGKGLEAAVLSGRVRQSVRSLRMVTDRPLSLIDLLNKALMTAPDAARRNQFTTLLVGTFTPVPGGGLAVCVAGGGHPAPLVVRAAGTVESVRVGGMPVGVLAEATFQEINVRLEPGEALLAYSDGVTEARGGPAGEELLGEARLRAAVASRTGAAPSELVDHLLQVVDAWLAGHGHDDIALLAVQAPRLPQRS